MDPTSLSSASGQLTDQRRLASVPLCRLFPSFRRYDLPTVPHGHPPMLRRLLNIASIVCLVLCVALMGMWVRSYSVESNHWMGTLRIRESFPSAQ